MNQSGVTTEDFDVLIQIKAQRPCERGYCFEIYSEEVVHSTIAKECQEAQHNARVSARGSAWGSTEECT